MTDTRLEYCDIQECASLSTDCLENPNDVQSYTGTTSVTHTGKTCQRWDTNHPHWRVHILGSEHHNYCRSPDNYRKLWCYTMDENTRWEYCDIPQCELSTETVTVTKTQATSATSVSELSTETVIVTKSQATRATSVSGIGNTDTNGEWSIWNDWKFCEVNCIREDTTEGKQKRWRTCRGSKCSGDDMEERSCSEPEICKGMRPRKLLCKCPKRLINTKWHNLDGMNITNSEVKKKVLQDFNKNIKSEIAVDRRAVSKAVRKKISSVNKRTSSQSIGWGCIVFLVIPMIFLISIDILNCYIHFRARCGKKKRNRVSAIFVIQDHKDSANPLQENVDTTEECYASGSCNNLHTGEMKLETYSKRDDNKQNSGEEWL
ncbi:PLG [Mytilus edulis]|uniref:PLG n=1 Tax=Mytilus edulis TaxID=6550 RepID=A0A8S3UFX9_MYTED|nr:PLG [Mytilus edulis]